MNRQRLSEHLRQYYEGQRLSSETIAHLGAMAEARSTGAGRKTKPASTGDRIWPRRWLGGGLAAAALALVVVFIGVYSPERSTERGPSARLTGAGLTEAIAREIARNHRKQEKVQFVARDFVELRRKMPKLDFPTIASARLDLERLRLLGGRYCSLRGQIANQIMLKDDKGRIHTLYETRASDAMVGFTEGELKIDGLRVSLWRESGLLFGHARPQD